MKQTLVGMTQQEITQLLQEMGQPQYRAVQTAAWVYRKSAASWEDMTDLPVALRKKMAQECELGLPEAAHRDTAPDGTIKYLMRFADGVSVESVYLPYPNRVSVCLSTQAGCAAGCAFCATAKGGLERSLSAGEIAGQFLRMQQESNRRIDHVVYMGMGEPLLNYSAMVRSLFLLRDEAGLSARNITVSTVGIVPGIRALAEEDIPVTLALSLHAPDDALRTQLIPTARKWPLEEILEACSYYTSRTKRNLTFEYLLLGGINDSPEQARALARLLAGRHLPGNVNLIPFNYVETPQGFRRPAREAVTAFRAELEKAGRPATQRMTRGNAIAAACGQLRRQTEQHGFVPAAMLSAGKQP